MDGWMAVNIASRLESMSKKLGWTIVASRNTVEASGAGVMTGSTEMVTPSGRAADIEAMEVLGIDDELEVKKEEDS